MGELQGAPCRVEAPLGFLIRKELNYISNEQIRPQK